MKSAILLASSFLLVATVHASAVLEPGPWATTFKMLREMRASPFTRAAALLVGPSRHAFKAHTLTVAVFLQHAVNPQLDIPPR